MGAVQDDLEAVQFQLLGKGALEVGEVAALGVLDAEGLADVGGGGPGAVHFGVDHQALDVGFDLVGQLETVPGEEFDAVVLVGIMGGRNDHPGVGPHGMGDVGDARGGQRAQQHDIHPHGADAGGNGVLQEVARKAGVFAHHDAVPAGAVFDHIGQGPSQLQGHLGGHGIDVGHPSNPVGAEKMSFFRHCTQHSSELLFKLHFSLHLFTIIADKWH